MRKRLTAILLVFVLISSLLVPMQALAAPGPVITKQPEDVVVSYPAGATFSVEVSDPESVASYKWILVDKEGTEFDLEGFTARTNTLVVPSTQWFADALNFYCVITDKDGNTTVSDYATLDADNRDIVKPVFYVGEFAIEPGESIDLSKVDIGGQKLGSGIVSFDKNATDITISNLYFDNSHTSAGIATAPNVGLDMEFYEPDKEEYNVTFVGDNRIVNTYYDYDYNAGGIPFDFYFNGDGPKPLVNFIGDGTLAITNGTYAIRVIGDLMVDIDITLDQTFDLYADGIVANNIMVAKDNTLDLDVYGSALKAQTGNLFIDGANIDVTAHAPHISMGIAVPNIFYSKGDMMIKDAKIDAAADVDTAICSKIAGYTAFGALGDFYSYNSEISYKVGAKENDSIYASDFLGIAAASGTVEDSKINITFDSPYIYGAGGIYGIYMGEDLTLLRSECSIDVRTSGSDYGIAVERDFNAEDSDVSVNVVPYPDFDIMDAYGIMCENFVVKITDPAIRVSSSTKDGLAVGCSLGLDPVETPAEYEEGYEAKNVYMRDGTECYVPENRAYGLGNVVVHDEIGDLYLYVETYYDKADTSKPAEELVFGYAPHSKFTDVPEDAYFADAVAWAIANGITAGTSETTFSPYRPCSRAEIVTFLWRAAGCPEPDGTQNPFADVPADAFYTKAVLWAVENGITAGTSGTTFSPDDTCTRAQIVTFLWRTAGCPEPDGAQNPFDDVAAGSWYEKAVRWAVENGVTLGTSDTSFSPADPCSRAQAVTMLYRGRSVQPGHRIFPEEEFGGVYINLTIDAFNAMGYEYGDSVDVTFSNGYSLKGIPYYNGYYTQTGEPLLVAYPGYPYIKACINNGNDLWVLAGLDGSDRAEIRLAERGAYLDIQNARDIHYKDDRSLFDSDEMFANFRSVQSAHIKENMLYRSASPCDNQHNRAPYSDRLIAQDSVKYIVNLADNEAKIQKYIGSEGFDSPYFLSLYESGNVIALALNTNFTASPDGEDDPVPEMPLNLGSPEFRSKTAKGLIAMTEHEGPYLIHCTEGKDRTGFICLLLEALCGASYDEIVDDYMITYYNYYRITRETDPDRYDVIVENVLVPMIWCLTGDSVDPAEADLAGCAENYLLEAGMNIEQISALRSILGR